MTVSAVLRTLKKQFPNKGAMELGSPYHTIVGVILSARTRDEQVLKRLPAFFHAFPDMRALAQARVSQIRSKIDTIGMNRQKAVHLKKMAEAVMREFGGCVPSTMDELVTLAGVGRKTASVVLAVCFDIPAIAVDTHVQRVTHRLGWVRTTTPEKTEHVLLKLIPDAQKTAVNQVFVKFGRSICLPGKPRCWMCPIKDACPYTKKNLVAPKNAEAIKNDILRRESELESLRRAAHVD